MVFLREIRAGNRRIYLVSGLWIVLNRLSSSIKGKRLRVEIKCRDRISKHLAPFPDIRRDADTYSSYT